MTLSSRFLFGAFLALLRLFQGLRQILEVPLFLPPLCRPFIERLLLWPVHERRAAAAAVASALRAFPRALPLFLLSLETGGVPVEQFLRRGRRVPLHQIIEAKDRLHVRLD